MREARFEPARLSASALKTDVSTSSTTRARTDGGRIRTDNHVLMRTAVFHVGHVVSTGSLPTCVYRVVGQYLAGSPSVDLGKSGFGARSARRCAARTSPRQPSAGRPADESAGDVSDAESGIRTRTRRSAHAFEACVSTSSIHLGIAATHASRPGVHPCFGLGLLRWTLLSSPHLFLAPVP